MPQGGAVTGRFRYTGQAWIPELGLYYYGNRFYHSRLGRFLQTDPIGYGDGMNLYAYVGGDPVNLVDPLGLEEEGGTIVVTGDRCRAGWSCYTPSPFDAIAPIIPFFNFLNPGHSFGNFNLILRRTQADCSRETVEKKVNSEICTIPGSTSTAPVDSIRPYWVEETFNIPVMSPRGYAPLFLPGGVITLNVVGLGAVNRTTELHIFRGTVTRTYTADAAGNWYASTTGVGRFNFLSDAFNQLFGPAIFDALDANCRAFVEEGG